MLENEIEEPQHVDEMPTSIVIDDHPRQQESEPSEKTEHGDDDQPAGTEEAPAEEVPYFRTLGACLQLTGLALSIAIIILSSIKFMSTKYDAGMAFWKFVGISQLVFSSAIIATTLQGNLQKNFPTPNLLLGICHAILAIFLLAAGIDAAIYDDGGLKDRPSLDFLERISVLVFAEQQNWGVAHLASALMFIDFLAMALISIFHLLGSRFDRFDLLNRDLFPKPGESESHYDGPDSSNSVKLDFLRTLAGFLICVQILFACCLLISAAFFSELLYMQGGYFSFVAALQFITCVLVLVSFVTNTAHYAENFRIIIAVCFGLVWLNLFVSILVSAVYTDRINKIDDSFDSFSSSIIEGDKILIRVKSIYAIVILSCVDFVFCTFSTYFWILFALYSNLGYGSKFFFGSKSQDAESKGEEDPGTTDEPNPTLLAFMLTPTTLLKIVEIVLSIALLICLSLLHKYISDTYIILGTHLHVGYWDFVVTIHLVFVIVILLAEYFKQMIGVVFKAFYVFVVVNLLICGITAACYAGGATSDHLYQGNAPNVGINLLQPFPNQFDSSSNVDNMSKKNDTYIATCVLFFIQFVVTLVDLVLSIFWKYNN